MQVSNNYQSPNFGMSLRIDKGAREALQGCSRDMLAKIQKAGEDLKDTKFYHVKINDDLSTELTAGKDAYFGLFSKRMCGERATRYGESIEAGCHVPDKEIIILENDRGTFAGVSRRVPYGETEPLFNVWGALGSYNDVVDIGQLTKIAKLLDGVAADEYAKNLQKAALEAQKKADIEKAVGNLLDEFGV